MLREIWKIVNRRRCPVRCSFSSQGLSPLALSQCVGKFTYARCGIIVNMTPFEPEWEGFVTLEISNTTPLPAKIYANEACVRLFSCNRTKSAKPAMQIGKERTRRREESCCRSCKDLGRYGPHARSPLPSTISCPQPLYTCTLSKACRSSDSVRRCGLP